MLYRQIYQEQGCIYIIRRRNKGYILLLSTVIITMIISFSLMIVLIDRKKTDSNIDSVGLIDLKIELESFALNLVGKMNVTRQVSETFKTKSSLEYRIDNYDANYIIYVRDPNNRNIHYYMIFNNHLTNNSFNEMTIFKDGYLYGGIDELES